MTHLDDHLLPMPDDRPAWWAHAACHGMTDLFFPARGEDTTAAEKVCATCPVRDVCLQTALANGEKHVELADWWATATYRGTKVTVEHQPGPVEALDKLTRRLLDGGTCLGCGQRVSLYSRRAGCLWTRRGDQWVRSCDGKGAQRTARR